MVRFAGGRGRDKLAASGPSLAPRSAKTAIHSSRLRSVEGWLPPGPLRLHLRFWEKALRALVQHEGARELLAVLRTGKAGHGLLTYASVAELIGRPRKDARAVAQMCDLLDAAAAYSRIPLLALTAVRANSGEINPKAWTGIPSEVREAIIGRSLAWTYSRADYDAIQDGLDALQGLGNRAAWQRLREEAMPLKLADVVAGVAPALGTDVDAGAIEGQEQLIFHLRRERNAALADKKRQSAMTEHGLKCEGCGSYSERLYPGLNASLWEVHHRVPLSVLKAPAKTLMKDLAILCPCCHRAIHRTKPMLSVGEFSEKFFPSKN